MDIVPNINKDNLSKERIEFLKKQDVEYKYIGSIKKINQVLLCFLIIELLK